MNCGLVWLLCGLAVAVSVPVPHTLSAVSQLEAPVRQLQATTLSQARVVVVNDIPGHFEVLAGVLHVLRCLDVHPDVVYTGNPVKINGWRLLDWLGQQPIVSNATGEGGSETEHVAKIDAVDVGADGFNTSAAHWVPLASAEAADSLRLHASVVICVSSEFAAAVCKGVVKAVNPSLAVLWVHRADIAGPKNFPLDVRHHFVALAPHVANFSTTRMHEPVTWMLPLAPYQPSPGQECNSRACLNNFTIQGSIRPPDKKSKYSGTRSYASIWAEMVELKAKQMGSGARGADHHIHVLVLGKGNREKLEIPDEIAADVEHAGQLTYPDFWDRVYHSLALVPAFGMDSYYTTRVSSSIGASLTTCTPLIAEQRLLDTYTFLGPEHVFLRLPGESEAAAMYRVASLPEEEVLSRRHALLELREQLTRSVEAKFVEWIEEAGEAEKEQAAEEAGEAEKDQAAPSEGKEAGKDKEADQDK